MIPTNVAEQYVNKAELEKLFRRINTIFYETGCPIAFGIFMFVIGIFAAIVLGVVVGVLG